MQVIKKERGKYPKIKVNYLVVPCMHCDNAPCARTAQNGAVYKRNDGIVIIDPIKSKGQKELLLSCPYRGIFWNDEKGIPQKCTFCAHLLDQGWKRPRCVEACSTGVLVFGDLDDPKSEVSEFLASGKTEVLYPEYGLGEKVRYFGLPKRFIAGSVIFGDTEGYAEGAEITIYGDDGKKVVKADTYGDFELDGLNANKVFKVSVNSPGYRSQTYKVNTDNDVYMGNIILVKSN